ncbi:Putative diaminopropionate ammonia-lyase [Cognatishimia activa]|uniref:Putative diaminopropionate ammonia-lyase n=2 Tax=Cognatishimia activa TaxID=1715691 RepID=A0A0P1IPS0_9RHOB|nr:Putative diaminopropionate ammonia-lyase [Cognatishimia activa]CUK25543.1 Putative diaminopropionate ammonia-lyase [Cognatishimia activa]
MELGAFKALGGVYAVAQIIIGPGGSQDMPLSEMREKAGTMTFICASAGNHGMAVAAGARIFGAKARIHLPETAPQVFEKRLVQQGAQVVRSAATYEESVRCAIKDAADNNDIHLADGSWEGYMEPPRLVMEGYTVIAQELREAFVETGDWPTDVFLQAGVGGLAAAITYMIRANWPVQPKITVVEPENAPCLRDGVKAGQVVTVVGPVSNMGRLDCKTASMLALEVLRQMADSFVTVSDHQAQLATESLAAVDIRTTPSGASGLAALLASDISVDARPLVIISEGQV